MYGIKFVMELKFIVLYQIPNPNPKPKFFWGLMSDHWYNTDLLLPFDSDWGLL